MSRRADPDTPSSKAHFLAFSVAVFVLVPIVIFTPLVRGIIKIIFG